MFWQFFPIEAEIPRPPGAPGLARDDTELNVERCLPKWIGIFEIGFPDESGLAGFFRLRIRGVTGNRL